jgi:hypothetical protein
VSAYQWGEDNTQTLIQKGNNNYLYGWQTEFRNDANVNQVGHTNEGYFTMQGTDSSLTVNQIGNNKLFDTCQESSHDHTDIGKFGNGYEALSRQE